MARLLSGDPGSRKIGRELPITYDHNISWIFGKRVKKICNKKEEDMFVLFLFCIPHYEKISPSVATMSANSILLVKSVDLARL